MPYSEKTDFTFKPFGNCAVELGPGYFATAAFHAPGFEYQAVAEVGMVLLHQVQQGKRHTPEDHFAGIVF